MDKCYKCKKYVEWVWWKPQNVPKIYRRKSKSKSKETTDPRKKMMVDQHYSV